MSNKKTVIITGGNSGLGFECARNIAQNLAFSVILACRSMEKAEQAKAELIKDTQNPNIEAMELDVSSLSSVRNFVERYKEQGGSLYGLVCNAGVNGMNTGMTPDDFDVVFETNHLGHFLLTNLLLPIMSDEGRIAVVSSDMHNPPGEGLVWPGASVLAHPDKQLAGSTFRYSYSKLCNLYFTYELAKRLDKTGSAITVNAMNPGLMTDTNFAPDKSRFSETFLQQMADRLGSLKESGKALSDMITKEELASVSGKYFDRSTEQKESSPLSYSQENALELWNISIRFTNLVHNQTLSGLL